MPGIREEIAGWTLRVPLERMQERVAEQSADFHVARHGEIVGGGQLVPLGRIQERAVDQIADFPVPRYRDGTDRDVDSCVPLTTEEIAKRLLDSPVPLTVKEIAGTTQPSRKSRRKSWQNKRVLFDWDKESRLSALCRLVADMEALLLSGQLKGSDHEQRVRGSVAGCRRETEARMTRRTLLSPSWPSCSSASPILRAGGLRNSPREGVHRQPRAVCGPGAWHPLVPLLGATSVFFFVACLWQFPVRCLGVAREEQERFHVLRQLGSTADTALASASHCSVSASPDEYMQI